MRVALRVPYVKQQMIGSCGLACVEMVRGWLDESAVVRDRSEMLPWARSWLFPFGMTESFGLAMLLADRGARVTVLKERPGFQLRPATGTSFDPITRAFGHAASPVARLREWEARRRGVRVSIEPVTVARLRQPDAARSPAIVMVNQGSYAPDPDWAGACCTGSSSPTRATRRSSSTTPTSGLVSDSRTRSSGRPWTSPPRGSTARWSSRSPPPVESGRTGQGLARFGTQT